VLDVPRDELFTATRGGGAYRDGHPIAVSPQTDPARALVGTGFPFKHLDRLDAYQRQFAAVTRATAGIRRPGSAALDLCAVACGRLDAFADTHETGGLGPWDHLGGLLVCQEAGAVAADALGRPLVTLGHGDRRAPVAAATAALLDELVEALRDGDRDGDGAPGASPGARPGRT
jgi:myo-inositol-1(or 4)-monophosphatase